MNHNIPGNTGGESWSKPGQDERNTSRNRRRRKRNNKQKRSANASASVESRSIIESDGRREYSADKLREAVIWVRDLDSQDETIKPLIRTRLPVEQPSERAPAEQPVSPKALEEPRPPVVEQIAEQQLPDKIEPVRDEQLARQPERTYFWNQHDVYQSKDRDILPTVTKEASSDSQADETPETSNSAIAGPSLDQAINPNAAAGTSQLEAYPETKSSEQTKTSDPNADFMARRRNEPAVQSQSMEGETFDRATTAQPFAEMPSAETEYNKPFADYGATNETVPAEESATEVVMPFAQQTAEAFAEGGKDPSIENYFSSSGAQPERVGVDHSLEHSELLDLAKSIRIDGVSVHEMFSARRIDETGLRRIVAEYLRGGELRDVITGEVIRQQLKFERDPQLRDTPVNKTQAGTTKRTVSNIKKRTKSLADPERRRDGAERLAEFTQSALEKSHELLNDKPNTGRTIAISAIVVIYLAILIIALVK